MAVALALGPIFILFILWTPTKGIFSAWLNILITIALIPVVTSAILVLMLSVINEFISCAYKIRLSKSRHSQGSNARQNDTQYCREIQFFYLWKGILEKEQM